jgi:Domain of unknown function (DUF4395)
VFSFPNPVNDHAARVVAFGVVLLAVATVTTHQHWLLVPLVYGFLARVLTGPRLSPLGLVATRVVVPRLGLPPRLVPGPAKRFAQAIGLGFSLVALVLAIGLHLERAADLVLLPLIAAASLEAFAGFCLGCKLFNLGVRLGLVPATVCEACTDIPARYRTT